MNLLPILRLTSLAAAALLSACTSIKLPEPAPVRESRWLEQNWSPAERHWYHHASQGTSTFPVPYAWFVALEQPTLNLFGAPRLLIEADYLRRFGFIPSPAALDDAATARAHGYGATSATSAAAASAPAPRPYDGSRDGSWSRPNPDRLPVGFARTAGYVDPVSGQPVPDQIGLTCAACHTGQIQYKGTSLLIDGGPAVVDMDALRYALVYAMAYTYYLPARFDRFAARVLGAGHDAPAAAALKVELKTLIDRIKAIRDAEERTPGQDVTEGFNRLDALNRIGNAVFTEGLYGSDPKVLGFDPMRNYARISAPVKYPHIWDASWFDWVQYDASIMQPMVRNAGEAMGVYARVNLGNPELPLYRSSVPVRTLHEMEQQLAGPNPGRIAGPTGRPVGFRGLKAPKWPTDVLGAVNPGQVIEGRRLYAELCQSCHLPPVSEAAFWSGSHWLAPNAAGERYLKVPRHDVGTDPAQYEILRTRTIQVPEFLQLQEMTERTPGVYCGSGGPTRTITSGPYATVLGQVVQRTVEQAYLDQQVPPAQQSEYNGYRPNCLQAPAAYKARPLDGIWAAAPYLHNGAVPTLDDLLRPVAERPRQFCLGLRDYDPVKVGLQTDCADGTFKLDTSIKGNSNSGHEFSTAWRAGAGNPPGVIGRAISERERQNLLAYLKTL